MTAKRLESEISLAEETNILVFGFSSAVDDIFAAVTAVYALVMKDSYYWCDVGLEVMNAMQKYCGSKCRNHDLCMNQTVDVSVLYVAVVFSVLPTFFVPDACDTVLAFA